MVSIGKFDDRRFAYLKEKGYAKSFNMVSNWKYSFSGTYDERTKNGQMLHGE